MEYKEIIKTISPEEFDIRWKNSVYIKERIKIE
jgi:hypothetical protein